MSKIINNADDVKMIISKYEWLEKQAERLVDDWFFSMINSIDFNGDDLFIYYETCCKGCYDRDSVTVPIAWLFLSDEELQLAKEKRKKELEEARKKQEEQRKKLEEQKREEKDREEYERLKKKYET